MRSHTLQELAGSETRLTEIQALVVELIHRLLSAAITEVDEAIDECLARLGSYTGRDRAYVFVCHGGYTSNTHEWCAAGVASMIDQLQHLPIKDYATLLHPLSENQVIVIPDIEGYLPGTPEHELLASQGIRSLLLVPMLDDTRLFGFVGFDSVLARGDFLPGEIYLLRAFADVIRSALMRRTAIDAMRIAQKDLAKERAFLKGIVSTDASAFLVFDQEGLIIYANDAAEDVLGLPVDEMLGQSFDSPHWRVTDVQGARFTSEQEPFSIVRRTGQIVRNHRIALHCDDGLRYASINAAPIQEAATGKGHVVYAVTDVTALVDAENEREAALVAAHNANMAKSSFLANMSHEIRTPLNGILGISDLLADNVTDPAQKQLIEILRDSGNLLMSIINDLLDMTKIEADALELESICFDLGDLARRTEEVHTLRASEMHLSFSVELDVPDGPNRMGDPHRLMQILHNLISNALKFTERGFVRVVISAPDSRHVVLSVEDSGIGMSPEQQEKVVEAFAQADISISRRFGGTGLGMAIVRRLIEMMGGRMDIESALGAGTCITVSLPLETAVETGEPLPPKDGLEPHGDLLNLHVLAADDNRTNQMILGMMLGQLGAHVTLADDGLAALECYRKGSFDLLLLDISMPKLDGIGLLSAVRELESREGRARTPALAFTANAMTHQVQGYLDAGFDGCLTKPLKLDRLRAAITAIFLRDHPPE